MASAPVLRPAQSVRDRVVRFLALGAASAVGGAAVDAAATPIRLRLADGRVVAATLLDNPTARAFAARLPVRLTLTDYAATEKIADLPGGFPTDGAPDDFEPKAGDLAFYAPWGNLAIFHRPFRYSARLIRLGSTDGQAAIFAEPGPMPVAIERAD